jgi:hypothetical protein
MKSVIITHRSEDHAPADFEPYLLPEAKKSFDAMEDDFIRGLYSRRDGKGAVKAFLAIKVAADRF